MKRIFFFIIGLAWIFVQNVSAQTVQLSIPDDL